MLAAHIFHNIVRQVVARHLDRLVGNDPPQRNHRDLGRTATYVYNHVSFRSKHIHADPDSGCHRFENHIYLTATGMFGRVADGTDFHFRTTRRDTDHHTERRSEPAFASAGHFDQSTHHLLGSVEVGNDTFAERTDRTNIRIGLFVHLTCLAPYRQHLFRTSIQSDYGRLIHYHLIVAGYNGIGSPQVHCQFLCERK